MGFHNRVHAVAAGNNLDDLHFGVLPHAGQADHAVFEHTFLGAYQVALSTAAIWGVWPFLPLLRL
jgi:hypothetical protein